MRELTKSIFSLSLALPLFGLRQLTNLADPGSAAALDKVTNATREQLGDFLKRNFDAGDRMQRGLIDTMFNLMSGESWSASSVLRATRQAAERTADALGQMGGQGGERPSGWGPMPPSGG
jgi:hypothetical protein